VTKQRTGTCSCMVIEIRLCHLNIIYGWPVPLVQLYDFISIVCLIPFTHTHACSPITFACTCIFSLSVVHFTCMSPACDTQNAFNFWLVCTVFDCNLTPESFMSIHLHSFDVRQLFANQYMY